MRAAHQPLVDLIWRLINERRASGAYGADLLSRLLSAVDEESGEAMSDKQVFDEAVSLFVGGHGTVAITLAWAGHILAQEQEWQAALASEVPSVLGDRSLTATDIPHLTHVQNFVKETLRLYPPGWIIRRELLRPATFSGYRIPARAIVVTSPYILHRDPRYFVDPLAFSPGRWAADFESTLPPGAYLPFGTGPRGCIGLRFATNQIVSILATIVQRWDLKPAYERPVTPAAGPGIRMLAPDGPINLTTTPRDRHNLMFL
jgi:cytochrome P450